MAESHKKFKNVVHSRKVGERWFNHQCGKVYVPDECVDCPHGGPSKILLESLPLQEFKGWLKTFWPNKNAGRGKVEDDESPF